MIRAGGEDGTTGEISFTEGETCGIYLNALVINIY